LKWNKYTLKTTAEAEDIISNMMMEAGIEPFRILKAATSVNAKLLEMDDQIGTIEPGKLADIAAEMKKGDYLFVSFGHNDSVESKSAYTDINSYKKYLNKFIDTAALCGANTVILTPPVRNLKDTDSTSIALKTYSEAAIEVAEARNVPYIDLNTLSASEKATYGDALYNIYEAEDARYANDEMFKNSMYYSTGRTDNTHLCKFGAEIFAGVIADELSRIYHPLMDAVVDFTPVRP